MFQEWGILLMILLLGSCAVKAHAALCSPGCVFESCIFAIEQSLISAAMNFPAAALIFVYVCITSCFCLVLPTNTEE